MPRSPQRTGGAPAGLAAVLIVAAWLGAGLAGLVRETRAAAPASAPSPSPTVSLAPIREATVEVRPNQPMVDTGLDVLVTDSIHIVATGTVQLVPGDRTSIVDPNGDPARFQGCDPQIFCGTLLASLAPTRGWSRAGAFALIPPGGSGRLYLRVNAADPGLATGSFSVKVRVGRQALLGVATPSPAGISRDAVQPGAGGLGPVGGAPPLDLAIAALIAGLGALLAPIVLPRLVARTGRSPSAGTPPGP